MNPDAILETLYTQWSAEDECYLARSVFCPAIIGIGETPKAAKRCFTELLQDYCDDLAAGRMVKHDGPGRPKKGKIRFNTEIEPDIKAALAQTAKRIGVSQGEVVEYLFRNFQAQLQPPQ
jgi:predicted RNase H-like HicB family nuclease